ASLAQLESDAAGALEGCVWKSGLPADLIGPSFAPPDPEDQQNLLKRSYQPPMLGLITGAMGDLLAAGQVLQPQPVAAQATNLPANFTQETYIGSGLIEPTNIAWLPDGRMLIAEKHGIVKIFKNSALLPTPFIDISDRVNDYFDHGLIGMAV